MGKPTKSAKDQIPISSTVLSTHKSSMRCIIYSSPFTDPIFSNVSFANVPRKVQTTKLGINKGCGSAWQEHIQNLNACHTTQSSSTWNWLQWPHLVNIRHQLCQKTDEPPAGWRSKSEKWLTTHRTKLKSWIIHKTYCISGLIDLGWIRAGKSKPVKSL